MNGLALAAAALILLVLQSTVAGRIEIAGARPDWLVAFVVFLGLYGNRGQAIIAGLAIGAAADLLTVERFGLLAGSYTLLAAAVVSVRDLVFRYRASTHFALTFVAAGLLQTGWLVWRWRCYGVSDSVGRIMGLMLLGSLYSAVWAPIMHGALLRAARWIGVPRPRYGFSGKDPGGMDG